MSKRPKFDESGDSDDLQALFDSIAAQPAEVSPAAAAPQTVSLAAAGDEAGDSDELQALFDAVSAETGIAEVPPAANAGGEQQDGDGDRAVFNRLGHMTRQLHDALRELGLDASLQEAAQAIPDTRQRLDYIAQMTEQAASRVLNATDIARPLQDRLQQQSAALRTRWDEVFAGRMPPADFRLLSIETRDFLGQAEADSAATGAQLMDIMMAQDFQDLTGQVIKRVLQTAQALESQLLEVLIETAPPAMKVECAGSLMNGPVIDGKTADGIVTSQEQVDDLLESLGF
ncbi:protein phosphatase CheZ [Thauera butanivorans]|jgi:chemotaxis protein CheZ|uniref:protein phosphatase CheZ n=1 Tax=Thauera butanivorans TaxID=86174 RepID=UPI0008382157|nr:protein phosphatase CheZ [Thauera butanivorans]